MTADRRSRISVGTIPMVYRRAHLFVAGHTFYWCTADRRRFCMRDEMASGNLSSVIYDAPRRTGASIVTARRDRDVPRIRRDPPTCGHYVLAQCVWITDLGPANKNRETKKAKRIWDNGIQFHLHFNDSENKSQIEILNLSSNIDTRVGQKYIFLQLLFLS